MSAIEVLGVIFTGIAILFSLFYMTLFVYTIYWDRKDRKHEAKCQEHMDTTGWICVDDVMPPPYTIVIGLTVDNGLFAGMVDNKGRWTNFYRDFKDNQVLYWQKSPDLPSGKDNFMTVA